MNKEQAKLLLEKELEDIEIQIKKDRQNLITEEILYIASTTIMGSSLTVPSLLDGNYIRTIAAACFGGLSYFIVKTNLEHEDLLIKKETMKILKELRNTLIQSENNIFEDIEEEEFPQVLETYGHSKPAKSLKLKK